EYGHEAAQLVAHPEPIGHPAEPSRFFPCANDFALHDERATGIGPERDERLQLPHILTPQRRRGLEAQAHERATLEAVPHVVLERAGHSVERSGLPIVRRARAGLDLEPLAQAVLVDVLLAASLIGNDDFILG